MAPHNGPARNGNPPVIGRSRSQRLSERVGEGVKTLLGRSPSRKGAGSPESVTDSLFQASTVIAAVGKRGIDLSAASREQRAQAVKGARIFVQKLQNHIGETQSNRSGSTTSLAGTIDIVDTASPSTGINPITDTDNNPFDPSSTSHDGEPIDSDDIGACTEDIHVHGFSGEKIWMRALLDTGMTDNAINDEKATQTGFKREPYVGSNLVSANGQHFRPLGQLSMQFYFQRRKSARTWTLKFLIVSNDAPFDVAFGRVFIRHAKLFRMNGEALALEHEKLTKEQEDAKKEGTKKANETSDDVKGQQDDGYSRRRNAQKDNKGGSKR